MTTKITAPGNWSEGRNWSDYTVDFGKHEGRTYADMASNEVDYLNWMVATLEEGSRRREIASAVICCVNIPKNLRT